MDTRTRNLLFFLVCIPLRVGIALAASVYAIDYPIASAVLGGLVAVSFMYKAITQDTIGVFGGNAWWAEMRLAHATLYAAFAGMALMGEPASFVPLVLDVAMGVLCALSVE